MIEIEGEYTTAHIMGLSAEQVEDNVIDQLQTLVDHPAFRNPVKVMPDCHVGSGAVIGFTMPVGERIVPNVIGVDIGCGMYAINLGGSLPLTGDDLEDAVRRRVPMGWGPDGLKAPDREYYNVKENMPWRELNDTLASFIESMDGDYIPYMQEFADNGGYDIAYFKELVNERAGTISKYFNTNTAIDSVGTLGSGNHFLEIGQSVETGDHWLVIHSGSRGLGENTAKYWQQQATEYINDIENRTDPRPERIRDHLSDFPDDYMKFDLETVDDDDLRVWVTGGMGEDFVNYDAISKTEREQVRKELKLARDIGEEEFSPAEPLDYLEGERAAGYLIDMIFCQQYASENRKMMAEQVAEALGVTVQDEIESVHNFVDFRDGIIRKGATRAYTGERAIVPFNMRDGTLIVDGKSNPEFNFSVAHGAGRVMSRHQADDEFTEDELRDQMDEAGAYAGALPTEEDPRAYKPASLIEDAIQETATVEDRLEVVHNWKAPE